MPLTKSKGNMYPWVSHVWSPIRGCKYHCDYCYALKYGYGEDVNLEEKELKVHLGRGKMIFVCHLSDMWGDWISDADILRILSVCKFYPENTYVFQSKNPKRFEKYIHQFSNALWGTTIETDNYWRGFETKAPSIIERVEAMIDLNAKKFVTIEPIMDFDLPTLVNMIVSINPEFITIGADSKSHGLIEPPWEKVQEFIKVISKFVEIRQKKNLDRLKK